MAHQGLALGPSQLNRHVHEAAAALVAAVPWGDTPEPHAGHRPEAEDASAQDRGSGSRSISPVGGQTRSGRQPGSAARSPFHARSRGKAEAASRAWEVAPGGPQASVLRREVRVARIGVGARGRGSWK